MKGITVRKHLYETEFQYLHFSIFGKLLKFGLNIEA